MSDYTREIVTDFDRAKEVIELLMHEKVVALDTETTSLEWYRPDVHICGLCLGTSKAGYYLPTMLSYPDDAGKALPHKETIELLRPLMESTSVAKVLHNCKFDFHFLMNYGLKCKGKVFDTMTMNKVLNIHHNSHRLKDLIKYYRLADNPGESEKVLGKWQEDFAKRNRKRKQGPQNKPDVSYNWIPLDIIGPYGCDDAVYTSRLFAHLWRELKLNDDLRKIERKEQRISDITIRMEREGARVNLGYLEEFSGELKERLDGLYSDLYDELGFHFNVNSPKQKLELLDLLNITCEDRKGKPTTAREPLLAAGHRHNEPALKIIAEYGEFGKLRSTYAEGIPKKAVSSIIHCEYNNIVSTGRLSCSRPNLQNIPGRTDDGLRIRKAFYPPDGFIMLAIDLSQIEMRVAADMSQDPELLRAYRDGVDLHTLSAAKALGKSIDQVTDYDRRVGKTLNFAILFGSGPMTVRDQLLKNGYKCSLTMAKKLIENYKDGYAQLTKFIAHVHAKAGKEGYVLNKYGRLRAVPGIRSADSGVSSHAERAAFSHVIQGTAADILKTAMCRVYDFLAQGGYKTRLILTVHDELIYYLHQDELDVVPKLIECMEDFPEYSVPIRATIAASSVSWGDKEDYKTFDEFKEKFSHG